MRIHGLYAITDPLLVPSEKIFDAVSAAIGGGAEVIQYRNKAADVTTQKREATQLAAICRRENVLFLINDNLDLALSCKADGVHIGQQDGDVKEARARLGAHAIIGRTCHDSLALALAAQEAGANYVAFGRFFPSKTKPHATPADASLLPQAKNALCIPVVAIGGITVDNAPPLIAAGADAVAVIHGLFSADDIRHRAQQFAALFNRGVSA